MSAFATGGVITVNGVPLGASSITINTVENERPDVRDARRMADCPHKPGTEEWREWTHEFMRVHGGEAGNDKAADERLAKLGMGVIRGNGFFRPPTNCPPFRDPALAVLDEPTHETLIRVDLTAELSAYIASVREAIDALGTVTQKLVHGLTVLAPGHVTVITPSSYHSNNVHHAITDQIMATYRLDKRDVVEIEVTDTQAIVKRMSRDADGKPQWLDWDSAEPILAGSTMSYPWPPKETA